MKQQENRRTYTNPVWAEDAPDPFVLSARGKFWAYATETAKHGNGFQVLESADLVHWVHRGTCFTPPWSKSQLWAPEVIERDGQLWMTYSAQNLKTGKREIGIATSKSPTGPFEHKAILVVPDADQKLGVIDTTVFVESDGTAYLLYSEEDPRRIVMRKLAADWLSTVGPTVELLRPTEPWEKGVTEAPTLLKRDGKYHLLYSANGFETGKGDSGYCVAHAMSETLAGPYKKFGAILAQEPGRVWGPGHQCVVTVGKDDWLLYHGWSDQGAPRYGSNPTGRTLRLDRLVWQDGMPQPVVASTTPQPAPNIPTAPRDPSQPSHRAPAIPLITHDPYFSVWAFGDNLNTDWARHWTGAVNALVGLIRVDGTAYRWSGQGPQSVAPFPQTGYTISATQTRFTFEGQGVRLGVTFTSPLLPDELDVLSRPASYITAEVVATDGKPHEVALYLDITGEWCVNDVAQPVAATRRKVGNLDVLAIGTAEQPVLGKTGDNLRIDWGYAQLSSESAETRFGTDTLVRESFIRDGKLPSADDTRFPRPAREDWPVLAASYPGLKVSDRPVTRRWVVSYDDEFSLEHLGKRLRGWWRRNGAGINDLVHLAHKDADSLIARCTAFDKKMLAEWTAVGGAGYAQLLALAWRQAISAHKLAAGTDGQPVFFSKENFSNGCIATVDVTYPSAPLFLRYAPALLKAMIEPLVAYAETPRWKFPFAPHDLGTYPKANGQVYGGGERDERDQMPVEESGNLLLLTAALARAEGNVGFAKKHEKTLSTWAKYLLEKGLDPENQLCTDDFAGHLAHNANLSLKAILAIGAWGQLCEKLGRPEESKQFLSAAREMAGKWLTLAGDGDHFRLAFDRPGTWSQKYNLVWDTLLGLNLFPPQLAKTELAFYLRRQNRYGLPLDNRRTYAKLDWTVWTATLAGSRSEFEALVKPLLLWVEETPTRVPLTDWYETTDGKQVGFQARSVVGGLYLPVLKAHWKR